MYKLMHSSLKFDGKRMLHTSFKQCAKSKSGIERASIKTKAIVQEPEPIRDTQQLVKKCCGLSKFKDQDDPDLKPDSEYPEWLWTIHVGKPRMCYEYDPNTKEYWLELQRMKEYQENLASEGVTFYRPPKDFELAFKSRLPLKKPAQET